MKRMLLPFGALLLLSVLSGSTAQAQASASTFAAHTSHSVSIHPDGTLWASGLNFDGQLGDGTTSSHAQPVPVAAPAGLRWAQVAAGAAHTLALSTDGQLYAWGSNAEGQLGDGTLARHLSPIPVALPAEAAATRWAQVAAGTSHSLALTADGRVYAWGHNRFGQLGNGSDALRATMVPVRLPAGASAVAQVAAGSGYSLALTTTGQLYAWGQNGSGQLGDGTLTERLRPVAVAAPRGQRVAWAQVAAGRAHTLAVTTDGQLFAWGTNEYGQLAHAYRSFRTRPTAVALPADAGPTTWARAAAGSTHSQALTADGRLYTWGNNFAGQLGTGSTQRRLSPVALPQPAAGTTWTQLAAGDYCSLALAADGQLYAWGHNASGQLGDGSTSQRCQPTAAGPALLPPAAGPALSSTLKSTARAARPNK